MAKKKSPIGISKTSKILINVPKEILHLLFSIKFITGKLKSLFPNNYC